MYSRLRIRKKSTRIETPDISTAPAQGMFQSRPFVVQTHSEKKSQQQPDLKTALMRAQRYGHHLGRMQPTGLEAPTAVQPKLGMRHSVESHKAKAPQMLQAKLSVGAPGDMYEQKADAVAAQVVDRINASGERSPAQESAQSQSIQQRKKKKSSQPLSLNIQPLVQRESAGSVQDAKPHLERSIEQKRGGGQPLSANIRKPMERSFGADFRGVKIHHDAQSDQLNQSIQAKAFTTGKNIFFRQGAYQPESRGGQKLLAHELTHVVQQNGKTVQRMKRVETDTETETSQPPDKKVKHEENDALLTLVDNNQEDLKTLLSLVNDRLLLEQLLRQIKAKNGDHVLLIDLLNAENNGRQLLNLLLIAELNNAADLLPLLQNIADRTRLKNLLQQNLLTLITDSKRLARLFNELNNINDTQIGNLIRVVRGGLDEANTEALVVRLLGGGVALTPIQIHDLVNGRPPAYIQFVKDASTSSANGQTFSEVLKKLLGAWTNADIVSVLNTAQTKGTGIAAHNDLCKLLDLARTRPYRAADVDRCLNSPNLAAAHWTDIFTYEAMFRAEGNNGGRHLMPDGTGGSKISIISFTPPSQTWQVDMHTTDHRVNHFCNGHTFAHFKFTRTNCTRAANSTFWPQNKSQGDVRNDAMALGSNAQAKQEAASAAFGGWNPKTIGGNQVGFRCTNHTSGSGPYQVRLDQFFPATGTPIGKWVLCAIGYLMFNMPN